jgi:hypothetical protein
MAGAGHRGAMKCWWVSSGAVAVYKLVRVEPVKSLVLGFGTLDCCCEHEPQIRFRPGPSPAAHADLERRSRWSRSMSVWLVWTCIGTV